MLCYVMLCYVVLCCVMLCYVVLCYVTLRSILRILLVYLLPYSSAFRHIALVLGHFQVGSYRYRSLLEALYTLNSPPVVSFSLWRSLRAWKTLNFYAQLSSATNASPRSLGGMG